MPASSTHRNPSLLATWPRYHAYTDEHDLGGPTNDGHAIPAGINPSYAPDKRYRWCFCWVRSSQGFSNIASQGMLPVAANPTKIIIRTRQHYRIFGTLTETRLSGQRDWTGLLHYRHRPSCGTTSANDRPSDPENIGRRPKIQSCRALRVFELHTSRSRPCFRPHSTGARSSPWRFVDAYLDIFETSKASNSSTVEMV